MTGRPCKFSVLVVTVAGIICVVLVTVFVVTIARYGPNALSLTRLLQDLRRDHLCGEPASEEDLARARALGLPNDLLRFYRHMNGSYLHATDKYAGTFLRNRRWWRWRILPIGDLKTIPEHGFMYRESPLYLLSKNWIALVDVGESDCLAVNVDPSARGEIIDCFHETVGEPGQNTVIARTFTELLTSLLKSSEPFWLQKGHPEYGVY